MSKPTGTTDRRFLRRRRLARIARLRWWWAGLAVLAVAATLGWVAFGSAWLGVDRVAVTGVRSFPVAEVRTSADVPSGRPLARVDVAAVERRVARLPRVEQVEVSRSWPGTIHIDVTERAAIAVVERDGQIHGLDRQGTLFRTFDEAPAKLPKIVLSARGARERDALEEVALVVSSLDPVIVRRVQRVRVASMDSVELVIRGGDVVRWGSAAQSARKAQVLESLLKLPASEYDVTAPDRPTTRS